MKDTSKKSAPVTAQTFLLAGTAAAVLLTSILLGVLFLFTHRPSLAFYNIEKEKQKKIISLVEEISGRKWNAVQLDGAERFSAQEKKFRHCSLVFAVSDAGTKEFCNSSKKVKPLPANLLSGMSFSVAKTVSQKNGQIKYVPFLYDMSVLDVNYNFFEHSAVKELSVWSDFLTLAEREKSRAQSAVEIPFGDDSEFLNVFGVILEALSSPKEYESFADALKTAAMENSPVRDVFLENCEKDTAFLKTLDTLRLMIERGLVSEKTLSHTKDDVLFAADNGLCAAAFLPLSAHRKISRAIIKDYRTVYCPSLELSVERKFCADEYSVFALKKNRTTLKIIEAFSNSRQTEISTETGLAPVQKNCAVADRQADNVRYWLAASSGPALPLSKTLLTAKNRKAAADFIRGKLR